MYWLNLTDVCWCRRLAWLKSSSSGRNNFKQRQKIYLFLLKNKIFLIKSEINVELKVKCTDVDNGNVHFFPFFLSLFLMGELFYSEKKIYRNSNVHTISLCWHYPQLYIGTIILTHNYSLYYRSNEFPCGFSSKIPSICHNHVRLTLLFTSNKTPLTLLHLFFANWEIKK